MKICSLKIAEGEDGAEEAARERQHPRRHGQGLFEFQLHSTVC